MAEALLSASDRLTPAHLRESLSLAIWKFTEADGKWNTRYRTESAVGALSTVLNHEHVVTRRSLVDRLLAEPERCPEIMTSAIACCVLRDEHELLSNVERARSGLEGWERYRAAGLVVVDQLTDAPLQV